MARKPAHAPAPPAPGELSEQARALWPGLAEDCAVAEGGAQVDYMLLAQVLGILDRIREVQRALAADGLVVDGSKGQKRPHPLIAVESMLLRDFREGVGRLGIAPWRRSSMIAVAPNGRLKARLR